ncbi:hypothetical protein RJ639_040036 [Escallonia herrerae]|uniref:Amidase domain-containing protein n=1 Tax=Escallonia herrerae TaxID=1293975 RepID=A0AA88WIW6_9ASTE|nr:hypothetical protein RJ639_040036 [Escallonia herrerae]
MDWLDKFKITAFLLVAAAAIRGTHGDTMVTGTVFCDQCKDGQVSLFDYPMSGVKVAMACPGSNGQVTMLGEETTNWIGNYAIRFDGTPDLSSCYAQVSSSGQGSMGCGAAAGPPQHLRLMFRMFDMGMYTVDPLLSQPPQPMSFCPRSASPVPVHVPAPVTPSRPPPFRLPPMPQLPPMPYLPPIPPMPPVPFLEASVCPFQKWTMPEHRCYWKVVSPDTKVAVAFGLVAARRYGTDMTLGQSMRGRGDPYRTLLREGTTALLNSYNSLQFPYHPLHVVQHMNLALMGSTRQVLLTALRFLRANSGNSNTPCRFTACNGHKFTIEEATIKDIQRAFREKKLTSRQLVDFYIRRIETLNPALRSVIEDSIATRDKLNTTCGSYALLGSVVARDAGVVERLRRGGAIIMGKASLSEWYQFRSLTAPSGWSPRGGQGVNPYVQGGDPCGSSSGSAISVAVNMVAVSLGTETDGSIICPADYNSVVGLKPTVGLTSRAGVIPITPRQDTIGPITRTVTDAVYVLDAIVGVDLRDHEATIAASKFIPPAGYKHFLNKAGLKGKRLGVVMNPFLALLNRSADAPIFKDHLKTLRQGGATVLENLEIASIDVIMDPFQSGEEVATLAEFKLALNAYLKELLSSPVRSLADIISFNLNNPGLERTEEFGQDIFEAAESTNGIGEQEKEAVKMMEKLSRDGFEKLMKEHKLDALVTPGSSVSTVLAIGGYPAISVPAGYGNENPYVHIGSPCGSSSGSAISVAANMVAVSLGSETHSSIICPADHNSVVGLKPTVGLTTRAGVIQMTPRWDTIGPICRIVADAVYVLDVIAGLGPRDGATSEAARYIPEGSLAVGRMELEPMRGNSERREWRGGSAAGFASEDAMGSVEGAKENELDAMVTPGSRATPLLAIGVGYPGITVPAGYDTDGMPFGILRSQMSIHSSLFLLLLALSSLSVSNSIKEATLQDLHYAFQQNRLTSRQLVDFYLGEIRRLNPVLKGVIEVNPDALYQADKADRERKARAHGSLSGLHGIPILVKDSIATKDKLNTTAGSFALLGSVVPRDAGVVAKLRKAGAIILGKASLSEWANFRSLVAPSGWSARGGQGKNPYVLSADPCGSSSGSAISVAANMVSVSLGTETDGSILCPSSFNAVVGIKPTVGLTSRAGVIPISPRQDTVGPICRTVSDAVYVLDAIVGFDHNDAEATREASKYIPHGGYTQFLKIDGLKGKRLGIVRNPFFKFPNGSALPQAFEHHLQTLRERGAVLIDHLKIANLDRVWTSTWENTAMLAEFKLSLNSYLKELVVSPVRTLADAIAFNQKFSDLEMIKEFGQDVFLAAEVTNGIGDAEKKALLNLAQLNRDGFERLMWENKLDALVTPGADAAGVLAIGGFPGISVPAAYDGKGVPVGICFGGLKGSEPKLIEIAYGFEQATKIRKGKSSSVVKVAQAFDTDKSPTLFGALMMADDPLTEGPNMSSMLVGRARGLYDLNSDVEGHVRPNLRMMEKLLRDGFEKLMKENKLDALVTPGSSVSTVLAIGGYPANYVPAGSQAIYRPLALLSVSFLLQLTAIVVVSPKSRAFPIEEATIKDLQSAFADNKLTSRQLVDFYIRRIKTLNPVLRAVIEVNPDAQELADKADRERNSNGERGWLGELHGIPVLVKDTIGTRDKLNTTAGSYALLGSEVARDAGVVERLREAGANPYVHKGSPCGSSSGSAISVAANMVAVSLGSETHSSIICPADHNSVVGLKPTVGLTTRAGVIPMTPRWDTIGPICRTVADAVYVLDVIAGIDPRDGATSEAARYIPVGGYKQFLREDGLNGKRLGIVRSPFLDKLNGSPEVAAFEHHINTLRQRGANVVDDLKITHVDTILDPNRSGELEIMLAEFKASINAYMKDLITSPVRSLADIIAFNRQNYEMEKLREHDQETFTASEATDGFGKKEIEALETLEKLSQLGFERLMKENELDAMVTPGSRATAILAIGGYPGITVPAGYDTDGRPFGICFGGLKWSEPKLIEIAYAFEQATMARVPPSTVSLEMVTVPLAMDKPCYSLDNYAGQNMRHANFLASLEEMECYIVVLKIFYIRSNVKQLELDGSKMSFHSSLFLVLLALSSISVSNSIKEATLQDLHYAFQQNRLTSMQLVEFYLGEIRRLNPVLRGVIEVNPDALYQADKADRERKARAPGSLSGLHGIPVLVKDLIATKDKLNTTAGSFALLGSVVPRDAGVVAKLRKAGAIILGKASLSEWANFRSLVAPNGWSARGGQGKNPYVLSADPCGSSSGSAISVAANMVSVSLGTETDGSILCPSSSNSAVGIKPTVGLTSRAGVIPISPRQDTVGPICRTVSDAVYVLDAIVGFDPNDAEATREASKYIPHGGYTQFLKIDGLMGKRLGIVRNPFFKFPNGSALPQAFEHHFKTLRERGAVLVDHLEIANLDIVLNFTSSGEATAMLAEFKLSLNSYLKELVVSPIRTLADAIAFNQKFSDLEMIKEFGQNIFLAAEVTNGIGDPEKKALLNLAQLNRDGFERLMWENKLDALVTPGADASALLAIGGFPGISVPAAYDGKGVPVGI